jgi:hypothetical protein
MAILFRPRLMVGEEGKTELGFLIAMRLISFLKQWWYR